MSLTSPNYQIKDPWHANDLEVHGKLKIKGVDILSTLPNWEVREIETKGEKKIRIDYDSESKPHISVTCVGSYARWFLSEWCDGYAVIELLDHTEKLSILIHY